jgi:hypothetical protein
MKQETIKSMDTIAAIDGYVETHHLPTWSPLAVIVAVLDFAPTMDGREVKLVETWVGNYDGDTLRNVDGSDGELNHITEVDDYAIVVDPDYVKKRLSYYSRAR